jgi:hypothetical protein
VLLLLDLLHEGLARVVLVPVLKVLHQAQMRRKVRRGGGASEILRSISHIFSLPLSSCMLHMKHTGGERK